MATGWPRRRAWTATTSRDSLSWPRSSRSTRASTWSSIPSRRRRIDSTISVADWITGDRHPLDAHLLLLLRALAAEHPGSRIELVSGYRSPKLNEMLRKKGHHVASHSQHSLGHACDFRIVPEGQELAIDPRVVEGEIRALGWQGGVGVYPTRDDWFVHADVGRNRRWEN